MIWLASTLIVIVLLPPILITAGALFMVLLEVTEKTCNQKLKGTKYESPGK